VKAIVITGVVLVVLLLASCQMSNKNVFMRGHKVDSGNYFLLAENDSLLFDDPHILHHYRKTVRTRKLKFIKRNSCNNPLTVIAMNVLCLVPEREEGDNTLKLIHKEKGVVAVLESDYTYDMPYEMYRTGKRLSGFETWHNQEAFLHRIKQLESINGLSILHASKIEPSPASNSNTPPSYHYLVNIYFPLLISSIDEDIFEDKIRENLRERLEQEMRQLGINQYHVVEVKHHRHKQNYSYTFESGKIPLHEHYANLVPPPGDSGYRSFHDKYLALYGYRADLFIIQIHCDKLCVDAIEERKPLDLLPSNISHDDFINAVKGVVEQAGGTFNPEFIIDDDTVSLPPGYINDPKKYSISGKIEIIERRKPKVELNIHWRYNLQHAVDYTYPAELTQGAPIK